METWVWNSCGLVVFVTCPLSPPVTLRLGSLWPLKLVFQSSGVFISSLGTSSPERIKFFSLVPWLFFLVLIKASVL